jgi:elongation factor G
MDTPRPLILMAIRPNTWSDEEKLRHGLRQMTADDPTISVRGDEQTHATVIGAIGEVQLEVIVDRLTREFGVEAKIGRPQVAYTEALTRPSDGEMKYARQTGGRGHYAHVKLRVFPGESGHGFFFENEIAHRSIPREFIVPIEKGIKEALARGVVAGYPIDDVRVVIRDGSYHEADSSAAAFEIAGAMAFQDAAKRAKPILLEPVMRVEVTAPDGSLDDIIDDVESRRGRVLYQDARGGMQIVHARVPLAKMFGYATDLQSRTHGRATCVMRFDGYDPADGTSDSGDGDSFVGAPRRPVLPQNRLSVELPEPDDGPRW